MKKIQKFKKKKVNKGNKGKKSVKKKKPVKKTSQSKGKFPSYQSLDKDEQNQESLSDFHFHSDASIDGFHDIDTLVKRAKFFKVDNLSITDHNVLDPQIKYLKKQHCDLRLAEHDLDGVNFIPGTEITCRVEGVKNFKGNDLKVHILVLAPTLTSSSKLVQLMRIKHGNDLAVDLGMLLNVAKYKGIQLDNHSIKQFIVNKRIKDNGFSSFGKDDVMEYFKKEKITIAKSMQKFMNIFDMIPRAERLNLSAEDVVALAHDAGALCIMAHPMVNLDRTNNKEEAIYTLLDYEIDGFELMTKNMNSSTFELITGACRDYNPKNNILYTGGSDFHVYSENCMLGRFGKLPITSKSQEPVLKEINILNQVREQKGVTHRRYRPILQSDLDAMLENTAKERMRSMRFIAKNNRI